MKKKMVSMVLAVLMGVVLLAGCNTSGAENDTSDREGGSRTQEASEEIDLGDNVVSQEELQDGYLDFSMELLGQTVNMAEDPGENVLISPASILFALDMAAMGAEGETYDQIASLICPGASKTDLNDMAEDYMELLTESEEMKIANSFWANEATLTLRDVEIKEAYLDLLKDSYDAETRILDFDGATLEEINEWVDDKTDGMIDEIIREFPDDAFIYLINAMAFEGKWEEDYEEYQINEDGIFHNRDGFEETAKMLSSTESCYMESDAATGFLKYYEGEQFAFLAILPRDEEILLEDFLADFDGDAYRTFYESMSQEDVITLTPAFTFAYENELSNLLRSLGMTDAFSEERADFASIAEADGFRFWISRILHKTFIELDESGTRAAAVTAIEMKNEACAIVDYEEPKQVILDRPFVFAIVDTETGQPVFMGTVNSVQ